MRSDLPLISAAECDQSLGNAATLYRLENWADRFKEPPGHGGLAQDLYGLHLQKTVN